MPPQARKGRCPVADQPFGRGNICMHTMVFELSLTNIERKKDRKENERKKGRKEGRKGGREGGRENLLFSRTW